MEDKQNLLILRPIFNSIVRLLILCWYISLCLYFRCVHKTKVKTKNGSFIGSGFYTVLALSSNDHSLTIAVKPASSNLDLKALNESRAKNMETYYCKMHRENPVKEN